MELFTAIRRRREKPNKEDSQRPALARRASPDLVPDVLDLVVSELTVRDEQGFLTGASRAALLRVALVCRGWNDGATPPLYESAYILNSEQVALLVRTLNETTRGALFRKLHVCPNTSDCHRTGATDEIYQLLVLDDGILNAVRYKCPNLTALDIRPIEKPFLRLSKPIFNMVWPYSNTHHAQTPFSAIHIICHLELRGSFARWFADEVFNGSAALYPSFRNLETLQLCGATDNSTLSSHWWCSMPSLSVLVLWKVNIKATSLASLLSVSCTTLKNLTFGYVTVDHTRETSSWPPLSSLRTLAVTKIRSSGSVIRLVAGLIASTPSTLEYLKFNMRTLKLAWPKYTCMTRLTVSNECMFKPDTTGLLLVQLALAGTLERLDIVEGQFGTPFWLAPCVHLVQSTLKFFSLETSSSDPRQLGGLLEHMANLHTVEVVLLCPSTGKKFLAEWMENLKLPPSLRTIRLDGVFTTLLLQQALNFVKKNPQRRCPKLELLCIGGRNFGLKSTKIAECLRKECIKRGFSFASTNLI